MKKGYAKSRRRRISARKRRGLLAAAAFCLLLAVLMICQLCLMRNSSEEGEDPPVGAAENPDSPAIACGDDSWMLVLVNPENSAPEVLEDALLSLGDGQAVDRRIASDLQGMLDACRRDGLLPCVTSSYRSFEDQKRIFDSKYNDALNSGKSYEEAVIEALGWAAKPGYSEHQTGLALDINSSDERACSSEKIYAWLKAHCAEYGFILRYPEEKKAITGTNFEPWHFRYVGREAAEEIMQTGECLEEYLNRKQIHNSQ